MHRILTLLLLLAACSAPIAQLATGGGPSPQGALTRVKAHSGRLFRSAWSDPVCSPTRATLLAGRHGFRTGIGTVVTPGGAGLTLAESTLPDDFQWTKIANGQASPSIVAATLKRPTSAR